MGTGKDLLTLFYKRIRRYVITRWGHLVPNISSSLCNMANMNPRLQDMDSQKYFGLYLSIQTQSLLMTIFADKGHEMILVINKNLIDKKLENLKILTKAYVKYFNKNLKKCTGCGICFRLLFKSLRLEKQPKTYAAPCTNQIHVEKV